MQLDPGVILLAKFHGCNSHGMGEVVSKELAYELPKWVGCCPSPLTKAAVQAAYRVNVVNLRDTGHSTQPAKAEQETVERRG